MQNPSEYSPWKNYYIAGFSDILSSPNPISFIIHCQNYCSRNEYTRYSRRSTRGIFPPCLLKILRGQLSQLAHIWEQFCAPCLSLKGKNDFFIPFRSLFKDKDLAVAVSDLIIRKIENCSLHVYFTQLEEDVERPVGSSRGLPEWWLIS